MAQQKTVGPAHEPVTDQLADFDWRAAFRERPLAWSLGALGIGLLAGCAIADAPKRPRGDGSRRHIAKTPAVKPEGSPQTKGKQSGAPDPLRQELENLRRRLVGELSSITQQVLLPAIIGGIREALVSDQKTARSNR